MYLTKHRIEWNWRHVELKSPPKIKTLKGHDDHVVSMFDKQAWLFLWLVWVPGCMGIACFCYSSYLLWALVGRNGGNRETGYIGQILECCLTASSFVIQVENSKFVYYDIAQAHGQTLENAMPANWQLFLLLHVYYTLLLYSFCATQSLRHLWTSLLAKHLLSCDTWSSPSFFMQITRCYMYQMYIVSLHRSPVSIQWNYIMIL